MADPNQNRPSPMRFFRKGQPNMAWSYAIGAFLLVMVVNYFLVGKSNQTQVDFSTFKGMIQSGEIKRVEMTSAYYLGYTVTQQKSSDAAANTGPVYRTTPVNDPGFVSLLDAKGVQYYAVLPVQRPFLAMILSWVVPLALMFVVWRFISRRLGSMGQNVMSFGQNKSRIVAEGDTKVHFSDVAGADEAKAELEEVVDFLKNPDRYTAIGGKIPKGVLLIGAPGTGKTLLARAVAGEAGVTFFRISGSEFVEMFVGVGAARVRDLFQQARAKAPCIIFVDELDAIGKSRGQVLSSNDEREQTLNQLLVEMDGFDSKKGVILLAATNRPEVLDPALLRPGRFDRQVLVDKPDIAGREAILRLHSQNVKIEDSVSLKEVARRTAGFVGADLANLVNEAAICAVRGNRQMVNQADFETAFERLVAGLEKKSRLISPKERKIVAYHETGHAVVAQFTAGADPVDKISIVPRGMNALGYTLQLPTEERFLMTQEEITGKIDVLLGGRAAEKLVFGEISTGASNDLSKAADIARRMITDYGMSDKFENVYLPSRRQSQFLGEGSYTVLREYAETTQQYIDEETAHIIKARYEKVLELLKGKLKLLDEVAQKLLGEEVIDGKEFQRMAGQYAESSPLQSATERSQAASPPVTT
jgi:cell division protease FtsH